MRSPTYERRAARRHGWRRLALTAVSVLLEIGILVLSITRLQEHAWWINAALSLLAMALVLGIYGQNKTSAMKMPWILLIILAPVMGVTLYLMIGLSGHTRRMRERYRAVDTTILPRLKEREEDRETLRERDPIALGLSRYVRDFARYPLYSGTDVRYFARAKEAFEAQLEDLRKAERFIFLEYHAIEDAEAWQQMQAVLEERVKAGVEVRVFYDDLGSIFFIGGEFQKKLEAVGIQCRAFNPFAPGLNFFLNNRDHRKITVIDGRVGYTGGYNLANEYFGITEPYGKWKDTGIRLEGAAVRSLTATFLEMWNAVKKPDAVDTDFESYLRAEAVETPVGGLVQPYADNPMDEEHVGENVYISLIEGAEDYVWFTTPYLIITDEMIHALGLAAKRGVDVRILTPGIPDKKLVYSMTRSYYEPLLRMGVRIYEWSPGFLHAKMCISDDRVATCGTINLDYRSLYHHFENGCILYGTPCLPEMRKDFEDLFRESREILFEGEKRRLPGPRRLGQLVLRLFASLL